MGDARNSSESQRWVWSGAYRYSEAWLHSPYLLTILIVSGARLLSPEALRLIRPQLAVATVVASAKAYGWLRS